VYQIAEQQPGSTYLDGENLTSLLYKILVIAKYTFIKIIALCMDIVITYILKGHLTMMYSRMRPRPLPLSSTTQPIWCVVQTLYPETGYYYALCALTIGPYMPYGLAQMKAQRDLTEIKHWSCRLFEGISRLWQKKPSCKGNLIHSACGSAPSSTSTTVAPG
jgi:hypothetical protein